MLLKGGIMRARKSMIFVLVVFTLHLFGCAIGPNWRDPVSLSGARINMKGKTVMVTNFKYSEQQVSYTQSSSISSILESAYVQDHSLIMAQRLVTAGIPAKAREGVSANQLKRNEILMRGAIIAKPLTQTGAESFSTIFQMVVWACSVLTIGGIVPSPFPSTYGEDFYYRVEFVDPSGDILYQSGDKHTSVSYTTYYIWPLFSANETRYKLIEGMPDTIISVLKKDVFY
jgi:hypothetical protein